MHVPFNKPARLVSSESYLEEVLRGGKLSGRGEYTRRCESWLSEYFESSENILLTTSCTDALEMSGVLMNLTNSDEIIVPSYTFVSTALAYQMRGATIRFCDIRPDTLNLDESLLEELINEKTKAIVVVHYAGVACEMDEINLLAKKHQLTVIEDNAHGLFGEYKDRKLGTLADIATLSFHETKNLSCGEGGAIILNTSDFSDRAEVILEKGTNRSKFLAGEVDKYTWVDQGSSHVLSDVLAAILLGQLEHSSQIQSKRQKIWEKYFSGLKNWAIEQDARLPLVPKYCKQTFHMFYILAPSAADRTKFLEHLNNSEVSAASHYQPLDKSIMGRKVCAPNQLPCPITVDISERIIRLPMFYDLRAVEQDVIIENILNFKF